MIYVTPDYDLRAAYIAPIKLATGLPVYPDRVPKSVDPIPTAYILITSQTNTRTAIGKPTLQLGDNYGWLCNIVFDINYFGPQGYSNPGAVNTILNQIIGVAETFLVTGWAVKSRVFVQSRPLNIETASNYINRTVLTYQHWIEKL